MEQNQVQINQLSDIQLKALAYDELGKIEQAQGNLRVINTELSNRAKAAQQGPVDNNPEVIR